MPRQPRPHKTSGEVYEVFKKIGRVGGNTVGGLVAGGKIFNVLYSKGMIKEETIRAACEEAGVTTEDVDAAFGLANKAREELGMAEEDLRSEKGSPDKGRDRH